MAEPQDSIVTYLRSALTDYNSTARAGAQWIYPDYPRVDLGTSSFPRIGVIPLGEAARQLGQGATDMWATSMFEITVAVIQSLAPLDIGSGVYKGGQALTDQIARDIIAVLRANWQTNSNFSRFMNYEVMENRQMPFDKERQLYERKITIKTNIINPGE